VPALTTVLRHGRTFVFKDWTLKCVSLVLALLAWFYIDGELTDEREFSIKDRDLEQRLKLALSDGRAALTKNVVISPLTVWPDVQVRVRGPRRKLQYVNAEYIDFDWQTLLAQAKVGANPITIRKENVASEVEVVRLEHKDFSLLIQGLEKKTLPVRFNQNGNPKPGHHIENVVIEPREVTVTSTDDLSELAFVLTQPIDVLGRAESFQKEVGIAPKLQAGEKDVEVRTTEKVTVSVQITREVGMRILENIAVRVLTPPGAALHVEPAAVTVELSGPPEAIALVQPGDVLLYVEWPADWDIQNPPTQVQPLRVRVVPPRGAEVRGENKQPLPVVSVRAVKP